MVVVVTDCIATKSNGDFWLKLSDAQYDFRLMEIHNQKLCNKSTNWEVKEH